MPPSVSLLWNVLSLFVYFVSQCLHPSTHPYIAFDESSAHVHRQDGVQQLIHSAPWTIESAGVMSQLRSKQSAKAPPPENSLATGGSFECNTFLVTALDRLKKETEKMNNSAFWPFQDCPFKMVAIRCHYYCRLGQAI